MSRPAIVVEDLGKAYRLGKRVTPNTSFREAVQGAFRSRFGKSRNTAASNGEKFWALKDLSLDIHPGEVVGVVGRNGAGKSTFLKILSRITEPTEGRVRVRGWRPCWRSAPAFTWS